MNHDKQTFAKLSKCCIKFKQRRLISRVASDFFPASPSPKHQHHQHQAHNERKKIQYVYSGNIWYSINAFCWFFAVVRPLAWTQPSPVVTNNCVRLDATGVPTEPGRLTADPANDTAAAWCASLPEAGDRPLTYPHVIQHKVAVYTFRMGGYTWIDIYIYLHVTATIHKCYLLPTYLM